MAHRVSICHVLSAGHNIQLFDITSELMSEQEFAVATMDVLAYSRNRCELKQALLLKKHFLS